MLKLASLHTRINHWVLTWGEGLLLLTSAGLSVAGVVALPQSALAAVSMLLAAVAVCALVYERVATRRTLQLFTEQLNTTGPVSKLEVESTAQHGLSQALNRAIQRTRAEVHDLSALPTVQPAPTQEISVAVLSMSLIVRGEPYSAEHSARLATLARAARTISRAADIHVDVQGDGALVLIFGGESVQPMRQSLQQALETAAALALRFDDARFGLSYGKARACTLSETGTTLIGTPVEDALRLARMATSWQEYRLLCAEPIALLARPFNSQRTTLELSHVAAPTLPVYALTLEPVAVALSA